MFCVALVLQFASRRYSAITYWFLALAIATAGTGVADTMHLVFGLPYAVTSLFWLVVLAVVFFLWNRSEHTLDIHCITTSRHEKYYWCVVFATFCSRHGRGGLRGHTLGLGLPGSAILFCGVILIPWAGWRLLRWNSIFAFWFAYVITRPIGASFADYLSKGHDLSGIDFGDWQTALLLTSVVVILVAYTAVARYDIQSPNRTGEVPEGPDIEPGPHRSGPVHKVRAMDTASLLLEMYGRIPPLAAGAVDGLDEEQLCRAPEPGANRSAGSCGTWPGCRTTTSPSCSAPSRSGPAGTGRGRSGSSPSPSNTGYGHRRRGGRRRPAGERRGAARLPGRGPAAAPRRCSRTRPRRPRSRRRPALGSAGHPGRPPGQHRRRQPAARRPGGLPRGILRGADQRAALSGRRVWASGRTPRSGTPSRSRAARRRRRPWERPGASRTTRRRRRPGWSTATVTSAPSPVPRACRHGADPLQTGDAVTLVDHGRGNGLVVRGGPPRWSAAGSASTAGTSSNTIDEDLRRHAVGRVGLGVDADEFPHPGFVVDQAQRHVRRGGAASGSGARQIISGTGVAEGLEPGFPAREAQIVVLAAVAHLDGEAALQAR